MTKPATALYVTGQDTFVRTLRKAGADLDDLKQVNLQAARTALTAVRALTPVGDTGRLARSVRAGATRKAGVIRAGRKAVPYAGVINYGWPARHITGRLYANNGVARSETQWLPLYEEYVEKTISQIKGADR